MRNVFVAATFLSLFGAFSNTYAQTGPAGIGSGDGSIAPRNVLWLKADAGITQSSGKVSAWADQSGNGLNAAQANGTWQPTYTASNANLNNRPSINFGPTGSTNYNLAVNDNSLLDWSSAMSFFLVIRTESSGVQGILNKRTGVGANQSYRLYRNSGSISADISDGGTANVSVSDNTNYVISTTYDHTLSGNKFFLNRNSVTSSGANVTTPLPDNASPLYIGNFNLSDNRSFPGDIAEVIIYNGAVSAPQRVIIENMLGHKYGINLTTNDIFGNLGTYNTSYFTQYRGLGTVDGTVKVTSATSDALQIREVNSSLDAGEFVAFAHDGTAHADGLATQIGAGVTSRWARSWYTEVSQSGVVNGGGVNAELLFDFNDAGLTYSGNLNEYVLLYRSDVSANFTSIYVDKYSLESGDKVVISIPASRFKSGYYTLGKGTQLTSKTWYVFQDGDWSNSATWTLDASTAPIVKNPGNNIPGAEDDVIIRPGRTVTVQPGTNNITVNSMEVRGNLYLTTSTGHNFKTINGNGQIRLQGNGGITNFPAGITTGNIGFSDPDNGGTLIMAGAGDMTLAVARTFKNLRIEKATATDKVILASNYSLYGNLTVRNGKFQFGDGTTTARSLTVGGDVIVEDNGSTRIGSIVTANANATHSFTISGNFTNDGQTYFTNRTDFASVAARYSPSTAYYTTDDVTGRVNTFFNSATKDQTVDCNNLTYFSRIVIDKGTDETFTLSIQAPDSAYFRLLGRANYDVNSDITAATSNLNAFSLIKGTVKLGVNVAVPVINTTGNYSIPKTAKLQIDGGFVAKTGGTAIVPYGTVEVTSGKLIASVGSGLTLRDAGKLKVDGGTVYMAAFRTSVNGLSAQGTYEQNGGTVTINGGGSVNADYALFSLTYTGNVFVMTGGDLIVNGRNNLGTSSLRGNIFINCDPGNQVVTGGTVTFQSSTTTEYRVTSRAPFYNVKMRATAASVGNIVLTGTTSGTGGGSDEPAVAAQPLVALNDLIIHGYSDTYNNNPLGNYPIVFAPITSAINNNDVYVGGSFYIGRNSTYKAVFGGVAPYDGIADLPTSYNTTFFNQTIGTSAVDTVYYGVTSGIGQLETGSVVLNRTSGNELRLVARTGNTGGIRLDVNGDISVLSGTMDQNAYTLRIWGAITNNDRLGTYFSAGPYPTASGTPSTAQIRFREDPPVTITTTNDAIFGNIRFNVGAATTVELNSDVLFERVEYLNGRVYVKNHTLTIDEIWNINNGGGNFFNSDVANTSVIRVNNEGITGNILVFTDGNPSDGGLKLKVRGNTVTEDETSRLNNTAPITFPVGFTLDGGTTFYSRPAQMKVKDFSDDGYVQINVVSGELQLTDLAGGQVLQHYWRVRHSDFIVVPNVAFRFYYRASNSVTAGVDRPSLEPAGLEENYVPGYVLDETPFTRAYESNPVSDLTDIVTSAYQNTNQNNATRYITFNGTSNGGEFSQAGFAGFPLVNANFTTGETARFVNAPLIYYTKGRDLTGNQPLWTTANTWTRNDQPGFNSANPHLSTNPDSPDTPGAGDIAVIGFFPYDDPKTTYRGYSHSARVNGGDVTAARLLFTQMTDNLGNAPVVRKPLSELGGSNDFQFRPTLTWNSTGNILIKVIEGEGTIRVRGGSTNNNQRDPSFAAVDLGLFSSQDSSTLLYEAFNDYTINNIPDEVPTLYITNDGWGSNNRTVTIAKNFTTNQNLEVSGNSNLELSSASGGSATINANLYLRPLTDGTGGGELRLLNSGIPWSIDVKGSVYVGNPTGTAASGGNVIRVQSGGTVNHSLSVGENIIINTTGNNTTIAPNGNGLIFGGNTESNIHLTLKGSLSGALNTTNGNIPQLYRVALNKKENTNASFAFNDSFTLSGTTNTTDKAIEIVNGKLVLNDPLIDVTLSSGGGNFLLPNSLNIEATSGSGGLEIQQGVARVNGANTGIILDGSLVISGGSLNMDGGVGVNNFIEYSASGNASIELSAGTLTVGSQVRRSTASTSGILKYTQTGGVAVFGKNAVPTATRGVFEVINPGSEFNLDIDEGAGESFTVVRHLNSTSVPTVRLSPATSSISDGSTITLGNADTPASQTNFGIYSSINLETLRIGSANVTAKIYTAPLTVDNLSITTGSIFNANGLDLTVNEGIVNDGTFVSAGTIANNQTTFFPTSSTGTISGSGTTTFWNLEKSGSGSLVLAKSVTVANNADILAGTLNTSTYAFNIKKDLLHDATHISAAAGPGIVFNGTEKQNLGRSSSGLSYFGVVNLNNAAGLIITDTDENFQVDQKLVLTTGVLDIGGNLLIIPETSTIENGSGGKAYTDFNVHRMIQTNSSIKDFGLRKIFPTITAGNSTFTFPVGLTSYTPAVITVNDISASYITVRPVADLAPIAEDAETAGACTDPEIVDSDNVLQYYWIIKSSGVTGLNGTLEMYYDAADFSVTAPYTVANYGPARLYNLGSFWDKVFTESEFDENNLRIAYPLNSNTDGTLEGIYTAGVTLQNNGSSLLCGAAIPDMVPTFTTYELASSGNYYSDASYQEGTSPAPGSSSDIVVKSGYTLVLNSNNIRIRKTTIEAGATLEIASGFSNHNLGFVTGAGTLKLTSNGSSVAFPTGDYEEFFPDANCSGGGGLEFAGNGSYAVLNDIPNVRRLVFSGAGDRTVPNNNTLKVCEDLEILGTVKVVVPDGNNSTSVYGNIYKSDNSSFDNGGGASKIVLRGPAAQSVSGNFTGTNAFNNLEINNANGVTIVNSTDASRGISANTDVDVDGQLIFTNGLITTNTDNTLRLTLNGTLSGFSSARYVNGPFVRVLPPNVSSYTFPVGKGSRSGEMQIKAPTGYVGTKDWIVEYYNGGASAIGPVTAVDPADGIVKVSENEYWMISVPSPASSSVKLSWNSGSDVQSTIANLRMAFWSGTLWDMITTTSAPSGTPTGGSMTAGPLSYSTKFVTFGTTDEDTTPLPVEFLSFSATELNGVAILDWATGSETNNDLFEIERSEYGMVYQKIGEVNGAGTTTDRQDYAFTDFQPFWGTSYYRIRQIDFDGQYDYSKVASIRILKEAPSINAYPNPIQSDINVAARGLEKNSPVFYYMTDLNGALILRGEGLADRRGDFFSAILLPGNLSAGIYVLVLESKNQTQRFKLLKK